MMTAREFSRMRGLRFATARKHRGIYRYIGQQHAALRRHIRKGKR